MNKDNILRIKIEKIESEITCIMNTPKNEVREIILAKACRKYSRGPFCSTKSLYGTKPLRILLPTKLRYLVNTKFIQV